MKFAEVEPGLAKIRPARDGEGGVLLVLQSGRIGDIVIVRGADGKGFRAKCGTDVQENSLAVAYDYEGRHR